ncbi:MAG TPA: hypothetical protein VK972_00035 [Wenzhouxiangella sp.]|nr:hypothetical protein [Wenzhouxiangella sp.]
MLLMLIVSAKMLWGSDLNDEAITLVGLFLIVFLAMVRSGEDKTDGSD